MLKNKEIENKFSIATKTLQNWSKSRPELYEFLKKSDDYYDKARNLNILLRAYEEQITSSFTKEQLVFLVELDYKDNPTSLFEVFPEKFLQLCSKKLSTHNKLIVEILSKLNTLSLIELYMLLDKIYSYQLKINTNKSDMKKEDYFIHLFKCFL